MPYSASNPVCRRDLLILWRSGRGRRHATYRTLAGCFYKAGKRVLVEKVVEVLGYEVPSWPGRTDYHHWLRPSTETHLFLWSACTGRCSSTTMCHYWDMSVNVLSKLSNCPNSDTSFCYSNYFFNSCGCVIAVSPLLIKMVRYYSTTMCYYWDMSVKYSVYCSVN